MLVDALLDRMSFEDMAFQLGSYWHPALHEPDPEADSDAHDVAPMEQELSQGAGSWEESCRLGLGHLTRVFGTGPVSIPEGRQRLRQWQNQVRSSSAFGIPAIAHEECLTGLTALGATVYPAAIAWGATWRPELIQEMANAIGSDMFRLGVHQGLSPLLDVVRDYRWGRVEETCGEDPYLVGTLGSAYITGLQSAGVLACAKHFVAYPASRAGRNHAPVSMGRRELEDIMLPPFEMAVREGGVASVMNSYSDIDGEPSAASHWLLTGVLRDRWGFEGTVLSDYWSVRFLHKAHRVAPDDASAAALALNAGLDVELPNTGSFSAIPEAVERGLLSPETVRTAARRVLLQKARLGLLDLPAGKPEPTATVDLDSADNRAIARRVADESIILLKNDGVLPLKPTDRVALIGPSWADVRSFMGCYAFPNHVLSKYSGKQTGIPITALDEALRATLEQPIVAVQGTGFTSGNDADIEQAAAAAADAEVAVVTLGDIAGLFGVGTSGEGCDVVDLSLPGRQGELLEAVLATGTPTVLILITGRTYALGRFAERTAAIIQAFMPGAEGAQAIVDVLLGVVNPSGKLPIAVPNHPGGQPGTYLQPMLGWVSEGISNLDPRPLYPFGHGLSYTSFELGIPRVSRQEISPDGEFNVSVTVANTGERDGSEVLQLYLSDPWAEVVRPLKQLIGFRKVDVPAGQRREVIFHVHADRLSFTGQDLRRIVEPGEFLLSVGTSSEHRTPPVSITVTGERRIVEEGRRLTTPTSVR